jgi:LmbE family N-acetylglucosaminyl deacetylase
MSSIPSIMSRLAGTITGGWSDSRTGREHLRKVICRIARSAMEVRSVPMQTSKIRTILVISPHPDDETLGCGGTIALLEGNGAMVYIAFVTDGCASHPRHPRLAPIEIAAMRRTEALLATSTLGVAPERVQFLDAQDGKLSMLNSSQRGVLADKIGAILHATCPDAVLLPCRNDGSSEHNTVFGLAHAALLKTRIPARVLEFPIWAWRNPLLLVRPLAYSRNVWSVDIGAARNKKAAALGAYVSQLRPIPPDILPALSPQFVAEFDHPTEYLFEQ